MLTKLKYEALILLHKAKWYYIEFYPAIVGILLSALFISCLIAIVNYFG